MGRPMPEAGQVRLKTGQPELQKVKCRAGDVLKYLQAQGRLVKWVAFEAKQE